MKEEGRREWKEEGVGGGEGRWGDRGREEW